MNYHFDETRLPADMTEGDVLELLRLTCKAQGLRAMIAKRRGSGGNSRPFAAALDATKSELRDIATRYR